MKSLVLAAVVFGLFIAVEGRNVNVCPDGSSIVYCFVDPCQVSTCSNPEAKCMSNYCGGCNAEWTLPNGSIDKSC